MHEFAIHCSTFASSPSPLSVCSNASCKCFHPLQKSDGFSLYVHFLPLWKGPWFRKIRIFFVPCYKLVCTLCYCFGDCRSAFPKYSNIYSSKVRFTLYFDFLVFGQCNLKVKEWWSKFFNILLIADRNCIFWRNNECFFHYCKNRFLNRRVDCTCILVILTSRFPLWKTLQRLGVRNIVI